MFSSTRMASSTTTPTDSDSASRVMKLMVKPHNFIAMNVPMSDVAVVGQAVLDHRHVAQPDDLVVAVDDRHLGELFWVARLAHDTDVQFAPLALEVAGRLLDVFVPQRPGDVERIEVEGLELL